MKRETPEPLLPKFLVIMSQMDVSTDHAVKLVGISVGMTTEDARKKIMDEVNVETSKELRRLRRVLDAC